jgi:hypothetical protein
VAQDKKSAEAVRHEVAQLKEEIEVLRERARELGQAFSSLDEDQLTKKVKGQSSKSPFAFAQSWTSGQTPGGPAGFSVQVRNPDPSAYFPVYTTIFLASAISSAPTKPGPDGTGVGQSSHRIERSSLQTRPALSVSITAFPWGCLLEPTTETGCYGGASFSMSVQFSIGAAST